MSSLLPRLIALALLTTAARGDSISNFSITLTGAGGDPYVIEDNGADGRDLNPAPGVIQFADPGANFQFQQGFFGVGGALPTVSVTATADFLEVDLTDLMWSNFTNPSDVSSIGFNLTWTNDGGLGTFDEIAIGTWTLPAISANAPMPLPVPAPVRGTISQDGVGGGAMLFDADTESNITMQPKVVALSLGDGPDIAIWPKEAAVSGTLTFDVTNVVPYTEGTHTVVFPGSAHWTATVTATPEPSYAPCLLLLAGSVLAARRPGRKSGRSAASQ